MFRRLLTVLFIAGIVIPAAALVPREERTEAQPACAFTLGFATLRQLIIEQYGDIVGQCLENEWHNAFNGDGLQRTTGGLMAWRKADNWTAFTNGATTWLNGPCGLQARPNPEIGGMVFAWEGRIGSPCTGDAMVPWTPTASEPTSPPPPASPPGAPAGPTATPVPGDARPVVELRVSEDRPRQGEQFTVRIEATDDNGIESIWWWATDTPDDELRDTKTRNCRGATPCRETWTASTEEEGDVIIHAQARDTTGQLSDEVTVEVRVRERQATPTPTATPTT